MVELFFESYSLGVDYRKHPLDSPAVVVFPLQGPPGRPGIPGSDGVPGPPGTILMLPVSAAALHSPLCWFLPAPPAGHGS